MDQLTISCPSCGFSRQVPGDRVPDATCQVTCPQCKSSFAFSKPDTPPIPPADPSPPAPAPPQASADSQTGQTPPQPPPQPKPKHQPPPGTSIGSATAARMAQRSRPAPPRELTDVGGLFKESWEVFQRRFSTLIGLFLLSLFAFTAPAGAVVGLGLLAGKAFGEVAIVVAGVAGFAASLYLGFRCFAGFLHAVADEQLSVKDALAKGKGIVGGVMWIGFLAGFIVTGGFLLFIIPGVIFTVWFCFAQFVLVREDYRGMDALLKSREYIRGDWFNVALRLLLVWAASLLIGAIPFAGPILSIVFIPYVTIFHYLIYRDLTEMKGDVPFPCGVADKVKWPGVALLGMVLVPVALISVVGVSLLGPLAQFVSREGITVQSGSPGQSAGSDDQGLRVITFPQGELPQEDATALQPGDSTVPASQGFSGDPQQSLSASEEEPENLHVFIYAVNYTGTIRVNGTPIREMEGKTDMQYNYNTDGRSFRYGQNQIEVDYAELPSHQEGLLGVKIKVSRNRSGNAAETLGEWRFEEKGQGSKSFTLDIPK